MFYKYLRNRIKQLEVQLAEKNETIKYKNDFISILINQNSKFENLLIQKNIETPTVQN